MYFLTMYFLNFKQMKRFFKLMASTLTIAAFAAVILVSCKKDPDPVAPVTVTRVTVAPSAYAMKVGDSYLLTVAVEPEDAEDKTLIWSSSNTQVATVDAGTVRAVSVGTATITATASNGVTGISTITVQELIFPETGVSINGADTVDLLVDGELQLTATIEPENATNRSLIWQTTIPSVAYVDANGLVTAMNGGETKIVVSTANGFKDSCVVRVTRPVESIALDTAHLTMMAEKTKDLDARPVPANATNWNPVWTSSNPEVATVTLDGTIAVLRTLTEGEAVITVVNADTISMSIRLTVTKNLPQATLFDFALRDDGTAYDASPNGLEIIKGPAPIDVRYNRTYRRNEAVIYTPMSTKYSETDALFPGWDYSEYAAVEYQDYRHRTDPVQYGASSTLGDNKGMGFYKIPWAENEAMYNAYTNAFSYEVLCMIPKHYWTSQHSQGQHLFGNLNANHSGFCIKLSTGWTTVGGIIWQTYDAWGNGQASSIDEPGTIKYGEYYHVVATYDRHNPNVSKTMYINGVKIGEDTDHIGKYMHLPVDYYWGAQEGRQGKEYEAGMVRQDWMENLWIGGMAHQSGWPGSAWGPNETHYVIARVYDKALSQSEIEGLYEAISK
jgi:uncharacterized protein YjdB